MVSRELVRPVREVEVLNVNCALRTEASPEIWLTQSKGVREKLLKSVFKQG